jgi:hypothetical protein
MKNYRTEIFFLILAFMTMYFGAANACEMSIPLSYAPTFLNPPVSGHYMKCEAKPDEQCLCIDGIEPWYAELVDEVNEDNEVIGKKIINSGPKRDIYLAIKAAEAQLQAAMEQARKSQACGKDTMAYLLVRNAQKQLSTSQVKQLVETYSTIKSLLESGSLTTAKEEISAVTADGVIVTEADKVALNTFIDGCRP